MPHQHPPPPSSPAFWLRSGGVMKQDHAQFRTSRALRDADSQLRAALPGLVSVPRDKNTQLLLPPSLPSRSENNSLRTQTRRPNLKQNPSDTIVEAHLHLRLGLVHLLLHRHMIETTKKKQRRTSYTKSKGERKYLTSSGAATPTSALARKRHEAAA